MHLTQCAGNVKYVKNFGMGWVKKLHTKETLETQVECFCYQEIQGLRVICVCASRSPVVTLDCVIYLSAGVTCIYGSRKD